MLVEVQRTKLRNLSTITFLGPKGEREERAVQRCVSSTSFALQQGNTQVSHTKRKGLCNSGLDVQSPGQAPICVISGEDGG